MRMLGFDSWVLAAAADADVQMVLDEEAEVFVVKMWRLLIYEIENKKQKGNAPAATAK